MKSQKLSDGKSVGGRGRLTDNIIDKMQNYYGQAIRENKGNLEGMKKSIKAIQHHIIRNGSIPLEKQHQFCPKDKETWCTFWIDSSTYDESNRLPEVFMEELNPIFTRLSNDDLLSRCLKGMTQNQNEAVNGQLWSKCSKTKFSGARKVCIAACDAIAVFNTGAASKAVTMQLCGVNPGVNTMRALRQQDQSRIKSSSQKKNVKYADRRRKLRAQKKSKGDVASYQPGGFGLSSQPEKGLQSKGKKSKKKNSHSELSVAEIIFVEPDIEVMQQNVSALNN